MLGDDGVPMRDGFEAGIFFHKSNCAASLALACRTHPANKSNNRRRTKGRQIRANTQLSNQILLWRTPINLMYYFRSPAEPPFRYSQAIA